jgi:hypothetical protein
VPESIDVLQFLIRELGSSSNALLIIGPSVVVNGVEQIVGAHFMHVPVSKDDDFGACLQVHEALKRRFEFFVFLYFVSVICYHDFEF